MSLGNQISMNLLSQRRRAMSLAEVLVSMGIMTIGLLGVAALFPVGGRYMQSGDIADNANAIAQAALDDAIIRGHLDPENWVILDIDQPKFSDPNINQKTSPTSIVDATSRPVTVNRLTTALRSAFQFRQGATGMAAAMANLGNLYIDGFYGGAFIIDPLGMAAALDSESTNNSPITALEPSESRRRFPATVGELEYQNLTNTGATWSPWDVSSAQSTFKTWPIRRVSILHDSPLWERGDNSYREMLTPSQALFQSNDDLTQFQPTDGDTPARQRLETYLDNNNNLVAAKRQSDGDYSWIISVSPGSSEARDALAISPGDYQYDVSVVVFHKRVLGVDEVGALEAERLVDARVVTTGIGGGELLLEKRDLENQSSSVYADFESPFENLRVGEYIMLTGPHPLSTNNRPMLFLQWYKVQSIEDSGSYTFNGSNDETVLDRDQRVLVSLRGPDWPWEPEGDINDDNDLELLPNDLRVGIIPGAVAVHTKTMRLESGSDWGR